MSELSRAGGGGLDQLPEAWRERLLRAGGAEAKGDKGAGKGAAGAAFGEGEEKGARAAGEGEVAAGAGR